MSIDFEYAIKKDIRNNPIVREIDREQKREFLRTIGVAALLAGTLLVSAIPHFRLVSHGYEVETLRQALEVERSRRQMLRLQLEERLAPNIVEQRARQELGMIAPLPADIVVVERMPGGVPSRTMVAGLRTEGRR